MWQPLSTAPRDGTVIIIALGEEMGFAQWRGGEWRDAWVWGHAYESPVEKLKIEDDAEANATWTPAPLPPSR